MIKISSGEYCDWICLQIEKIPDISILVDQTNTNTDTDQYITKNKNGFTTLLSELYQVTKGQFCDELLLQNNSYELLWQSVPVSNQTYKAEINFYLIIRSIDYNPSILQERLSDLKAIFLSSFSSLKYTVKDLSSTFTNYSALQKLNKIAIVKEDIIGNLQSYYMNQCYIFDKVPEISRDFGPIVDYLSRTPNACISIQLIPTYYTFEEKSFIERTSGVLDTINRGVHDMMIGNVINPVAERYAVKYKYYEKNKNAALFCYNILLMAQEKDIFGLAAKICGHIDCGSNQEDKISLRTIKLNSQDIDVNRCAVSLPWLLNDIVMDKLYQNFPIYYQENFDFRRLVNIITADEAAEIFCLPIGSKTVSNGLQIDYSLKDSKIFHKKIINSDNIEVGRLKSSFDDNTIGFSLKDLNRHMLIVGVPGMGKTTYSIGLLDTIWEKYNIPFLVIEPAKSEYRAMIKAIPDLQVFTFGKDEISPMPINPFVPPKGVRIKQYKSILKTAFSAGVSNAESLTKLFEETLEEIYLDFGWFDSDTVETGKGEIFNIRDFALCFKKIFESHGYVGEAKNVGTAGLLRLVSMANLFDNYYTVPIEDLLSKPTVIELAAVQNKDEKSFIMALILLNISAYIDSNYLGEGKLKNVVLIEEAHNLLATSDAKEEGSAQPNAVAQELVKNMLAEKRAQGLGIIIADQSPENVGSDVIKLTNIKLGFNLAEKSDKEIFANSTNMSVMQIERMTQLVEGEAFFFMGGMSTPEEVSISDYRQAHDIAVTISDSELKQKTTYWDDKPEKLKPYPECKYNEHCGKSCKLKQREIADNIARSIFNKKVLGKKIDDKLLGEIFMVFGTLIKDIIGDNYPLNKSIFYCAKISLLRKIKYETDFNVTKKVYSQVLSKAKKSKG